MSVESALEEIIAGQKLNSLIHLAALACVQESMMNQSANFRLSAWASHLVAELANHLMTHMLRPNLIAILFLAW